jgi:hypothetical protein
MKTLSVVVLLLRVRDTLHQYQTSFHEQTHGKNVIIIANLFRLRRHKLAVTPMKKFELPDEIKCLTSCVKTDGCYSANTKKLANDDVMCELMNHTMYEYPQNLTKDESSSHWFTKVRF